jgi:hypothetical protein
MEEHRRCPERADEEVCEVVEGEKFFLEKKLKG